MFEKIAYVSPETIAWWGFLSEQKVPEKKIYYANMSEYIS